MAQHYADIIAAILGPVAQGGADAFRTYQEGKQGKSELKQRGREFDQMTDLQRKQMEVAERQQMVAQVAALRQAQLEESARVSYVPYLAAAAVFGGIALIAVAAVRRKRGS